MTVLISIQLQNWIVFGTYHLIQDVVFVIICTGEKAFSDGFFHTLSSFRYHSARLLIP